MVMVIVLAVKAFPVAGHQRVFGPHTSVPASGTADLIIQFKPEGVIYEVYGPVGRMAAGALRCWSQLASSATDWRVTDRLAKGV